MSRSAHITATILLDGCLTLRALFRVGRDPVGGLAVVRALLQPFLDERTYARLMIRQPAPEAESVAAAALYSRDDRVERFSGDVTFYRQDAIRCWTPPQRWVVVDISAVQ